MTPMGGDDAGVRRGTINADMTVAGGGAGCGGKAADCKPPTLPHLCRMKLRLDLLEHLKDEDILEEVLANNHRYRPEPLFSRTGVGSLSSASTGRRASEEERSTALIAKLTRRAQQTGKKPEDGS